MLFLNFVKWDVIKLQWSEAEGTAGSREIDSGTLSTDYIFEPTVSDGRYTFVAKGCAKAADGSTGYCSPSSRPHDAFAAHNTTSVKQFLKISGVWPVAQTSLRDTMKVAVGRTSLRSIMGL